MPPQSTDLEKQATNALWDPDQGRETSSSSPNDSSKTRKSEGENSAPKQKSSYGKKFLLLLLSFACLMLAATVTLVLIDRARRDEELHGAAPISDTKAATNEATFSPASSTASPVATIAGKPTVSTTNAPVQAPAPNVFVFPTKAPTRAPITPLETPHLDASRAFFPQTVVLRSGQGLNPGEYVSSPSGAYKVGLDSTGDLVLKESNSDSIIWQANVSGGLRLYMQGDGNLIIRDEFSNPLWSTRTENNALALFVIDDSGLIGVKHDSFYIWMQGFPRGKYTGPPYAGGLTYPIRATMYYAWYPDTWTVGGQNARFEPDLGFYKSADSSVVRKHIDYMEYGKINVGIISWWGPSTNNDRSRITLLMNETMSLKSDIKWTVYYEESGMESTEAKIGENLAYLKKWFAWHPTWAHIDGKPVIYVNNNAGCDTAERWMKASNGEWYVALKLFPGFSDCSVQPDSWHQFSPSEPILRYKGHSVSISPGYWLANEVAPRLPRLNVTEWCNNVQEMLRSREKWQLITSFNNAGDGTIIEPSAAWASASGYGYYLDCMSL